MLHLGPHGKIQVGCWHFLKDPNRAYKKPHCKQFGICSLSLKLRVLICLFVCLSVCLSVCLFVCLWYDFLQGPLTDLSEISGHDRVEEWHYASRWWRSVDDRRNDVSEWPMMSWRNYASAVTSHVAMQTNVKIRKSPKIPKPVRLARSHIAHVVH